MGRVAMLAVIGFLVGEKVEGSSFLFDSQISGPAISHFFQVPNPFWEILVLAIGGLELNHAQVASSLTNPLIDARQATTGSPIRQAPMWSRPVRSFRRRWSRVCARTFPVRSPRR